MVADVGPAGGPGGGTVYRTIAIGAGLLSLCLVGFIMAVMITGNNPMQIAGLVEAVPVQLNDKVTEGEVLIRLDDKDARARLSAAEAQAATSKKERDAQPIPAGRENVSKAEDAVFTAERNVMSARFELDDAIAANRKNPGNSTAVSNARRRLADAKERLRQEQSAYASAQNRSGVP